MPASLALVTTSIAIAPSGDGEVAQPLRDGAADQALQEAGVGGQPGQHVAGAHGLEEGGRQGEHAVEQGGADVGGDPLAEPGDEVEAGPGGGAEPGHDGEHGERGVIELRAGRGGEADIDELPHPLPQQQDQPGGERQRRPPPPAPGRDRAQERQQEAERREAVQGASSLMLQLLK